jgi:hypothetical protein
MKQLMFFFSLLWLVTGCENTEVVNSVLQAEIDNNFFRALDARVTPNEDGSYLIQGITQYETLTLRVSSLEIGSYELGGTLSNYASFENFDGATYYTNPLGDGSVTISNINEEAQTVTGSFKFNAMLEGIDTIAVQRGIFFEAPISIIDDEPIIDPVTHAGTFVSQINGAIFNPFNVTAIESDDSIVIKGYTTNRSITLVLPRNVIPDDYILPGNGFSAFYEDNDGIQYATNGGILVFSHDTNTNEIKGTFFFLTPTKSISIGQFNVTYQ